ncbi:MAG TPA: HAMP domain-containing sensor histidine kinase [Longimicrobiales bacterium]
MTVATRLSLAFGLLVLLLIAALAYQAITVRRLVSSGSELSAMSARLEMSAAEQLSQLDRLEEAASKYLVTRDPRYHEVFQSTLAAFDSTLRRMASMPLPGPARAELARLRVLWAAFPARAEQRFQLAFNAKAEAQVTTELSGLFDDIGQLNAQTRRLTDASREAIRRRLEESAAAGRNAERASIAFAAAAILLSGLVAASIIRSIADSLRRLQRGTQQVAEGNFAYRIETRHDDEFAQLARDFNLMTLRLAELDRMKRDFLSKVSHDLKTPLASMQETSRILLDGVPGTLTPKQRRLLELNLQSAQRLSGMISKILDLSAMEAGAVPLELRQHDLLALVRQAVEIAAPALDEDELRIITELPETPVLVECDGERILRVLDNLLENAAKFSPRGETIRVSVRLLTAPPPEIPSARWQDLAAHGRTGCVALVSVADAGPGVPEADKEKIFERFYQSAGARKVRNRGVGLGLAICREILDAHGGAIWVEDGPGGGSIFSFALPNARAAAAESLPAIARG